MIVFPLTNEEAHLYGPALPKKWNSPNINCFSGPDQHVQLWDSHTAIWETDLHKYVISACRNKATVINLKFNDSHNIDSRRQVQTLIQKNSLRQLKNNTDCYCNYLHVKDETIRTEIYWVMQKYIKYKDKSSKCVHVSTF